MLVKVTAALLLLVMLLGGLSGSHFLSSSSSSSSAQGHQLSWTTGGYPVVGGKTKFPPLPVPSGHPNSFSTLWYAGSQYTGLTENARSIKMQIRTPTSLPRSDEFYYVLVSIWDSASSYDQIGFSDDFGVWGLTYSYTTGPCSSLTFNYNPDVLNLNLATKYTFYIFADPTFNGGAGGTLFQVYLGKTQVFSDEFATNAQYLSVAQFGCGGAYYNYQNYEEIHYTHTNGGHPNFNFNFVLNEFDFLGYQTAQWGTFYSGSPSAVSVAINGQQVKIHN